MKQRTKLNLDELNSKEAKELKKKLEDLHIPDKPKKPATAYMIFRAKRIQEL